MAKIKPPTRSPATSKSRDLVPVGSKQVFLKNPTKRNENGDKPSTVRALILRNGRRGARGSGELMMLTSKMTGSEKLDLLAEDMIGKYSKAILGPFRLEQCLKIAESQFHAYLDEIAHLQDPTLFYHIIEAEYRARQSPNAAGGGAQWKNASYMASVIATTIHNTYVLASGWSIVLDALRELKTFGFSESTAKVQLQKFPKLRSRYLVLYDMVGVLANMSQAKFSVLATTTPHFARYFKRFESSDPTDPEFVFDWQSLREACKSFLDSIIIELCFPHPPYPRHILFQLLRDAMEEAPRDGIRFTQELWDAVGDLSVTVELQEMLERPLMGPEGDIWKQAPRQMPERFESWVDAERSSQKASTKFANYKDLVHPLEKSKTQQVLDNMWKYVNLNYTEVSGMDIDSLFRLGARKHRTPQWHSIYVPGLHIPSDEDLPKPSTSRTKKGLLAITDGNASTSSLPALLSASDSSSATSDHVIDSESESDEDLDDSDGSGYNTEEEDEMRDLLREAMDIAHESDFFNLTNASPDSGAYAEERKSNPFLKLLGSLRGRMFSANPNLKITDRKEIRGQATPAAEPAETDGDKSHKAVTIEEVEDEDAVQAVKKKKKKPKKKKKKPTSVQVATAEDPVAVESPPTSPIQAKTAPPAPAPTAHGPPTPSQTPSKTLKSPSLRSVSTPSMNASATTLPHASVTSLPIEPTTAQSARAYLKAEKLEVPKSKVKSRPEQGPLESIPEKKKSIFSKFTKSKANEELEADQKDNIPGLFSRLSKKTTGYMSQLLGSSKNETQGAGSMKWDNFLKVMREMGFTSDPSTAGSSVRFDPPDKRDKPITFHRPHPTDTLSHVKVMRYGKRLKDYYGWSKDEFLKYVE